MRGAAVVERRGGRGGWSSRGRALARFALVALGVAATYALTLYGWRTADFDVGEYAEYARAFWAGNPPFAAFPLEYPPLALAPFGLALLAGPFSAPAAFGLWMGALFLLGYLGYLRFSSSPSPRGAALRYAAYLLLAAQATLLARYDLVPALVTLAALWAARRRRFALAYVLLAAGILLKLYPLALLPAIMIEHGRAARPRGGARAALLGPLVGGAACLGSVALVSLAALLRDPRGGLAFFAYATERPIQVESFPATLLWLGTFLGVPAAHGYAFGSDSYTGPLAGGAGWGAMVVAAAGCALVYWRQASGRLTIERASLLALGLALLASKVLSTQYLVWVLPLAAEVGGGELAWLAICALTSLDYPLLYPFNQPGYTRPQEFAFMAVVAARNLLLLALTLRPLLRPAARAQGDDASVPSMKGMAERATAAGSHPG